MLNDYLLTVISNIGMISLIALSAYLLLITGEISFGQEAYFGISAYYGAMTTATEAVKEQTVYLNERFQFAKKMRKKKRAK